ncbi:hypothetical protein KM043_000763 [Ampulex compressa]|nr:hypothetical protein KM043_000763 [Ampulex compressa]
MKDGVILVSSFGRKIKGPATEWNSSSHGFLQNIGEHFAVNSRRRKSGALFAPYRSSEQETRVQSAICVPETSSRSAPKWAELPRVGGNCLEGPAGSIKSGDAAGRPSELVGGSRGGG